MVEYKSCNTSLRRHHFVRSFVTSHKKIITSLINFPRRMATGDNTLGSLPRGLKINKVLGSGGFGRVYLATHENSLKMYVVKTFLDSPSLQKIKWNGSELPLEIALLKFLNHPNIVQYKAHFLENNQWYLLMDHETGFTDLFTLSRKYRLDSRKIRSIGRQLYQALDYCLKNNVDHADVKEENILYNPKTDRVKLIDFGAAILLSGKTGTCYSTLHGTTLCLPPEAFTARCYFPLQSNVWMVGCVLYGCVTGRAPFIDTADILIKRARVSEKDRTVLSSENLVELVEKCLEPNRISRISWTELGRCF